MQQTTKTSVNLILSRLIVSAASSKDLAIQYIHISAHLSLARFARLSLRGFFSRPQEESGVEADHQGQGDIVSRIRADFTGLPRLDLRTKDLIEQRDVPFREDIAVDIVYVELLLARWFEGNEEETPVCVPYVRLPVNTILDTVNIRDRHSDEDSGDDDVASVDGDSAVASRKGRCEDSSNNGDDLSNGADFSGIVAVDNGAGASGSSASSGSPGWKRAGSNDQFGNSTSDAFATGN
ncbi:hypothetical protein ON010_g11285 [Phytophthora cinnamomi]|nr:hypothetical protein ON010_g11285 [Phytophthora cinnamomi]